MVNIIKQEIEIEEALKNKIEFICSFCNTTPTIFNGSIRTIEHTNLTYVEPHRIIIKDKLFGKKEEREQYMDVANELYNNDIIDTNQFDEMYGIYESSENYDNNRGKSDDFEL
ncbi:MAG: hypothetical protein IJZ46_03125 [Bacilli bacterium]|nr:hypothetical protein [Bacilli bacterium]